MASLIDGRPRVTLRQGTVVGTTIQDKAPKPVEAFLGVPYALPPVGDRRFRPPARVEASSDIIDASKYGPRAPAKQFVIIGPELPESEDCLTVNVFRPVGAVAESSSSKLPVAISYHGGAFNRGNAAMYDSATVVGWGMTPFIIVTCGYRIGALGFLPSKLSAEEGILNLGLKDQIMVMEWVQENIGAFGGDKDNVTLIGLSAGAHSIGHHLLNYDDGKAPLFQRVVMESGAPTSRAVRHHDAPIHEQQFADYLKEVGCSLDPKTAPASEVFTFLRSLPTEVVAAAQTKVFYAYNPSLRWAFQPVIDGEIIKTRPIDAWKSGRWHRVPILTGFQHNEGSIYVDKKMDTSEQFSNFWRTLLPQLSDEDLTRIEALYPDPLSDQSSPYKEKGGAGREGLGSQFNRIEAAYAHYAYVAPVRQTAYFAGGEVPTYIYHWALKRSVVNGAAHGDNLYFEMRDKNLTGKDESLEKLSRVYHAYITSFICTGNPNSLAMDTVPRPVWVPHSGKSGSPENMIFGEDNDVLIGGNLRGQPSKSVPDVWAKVESDFWWEKVPISQL